MRTYHLAGFSLLDSLVAVAILGTLMSIAAPALSVWQERQKFRSLKIGLFHMAHQARYLAMTSQSRVTICSLSTQGQCLKSWGGSISSFIDRNGNRQLDLEEEIFNTLYVPSNVTLRWHGMLPNNSIHFSSQGVTFVSNGTMSLCASRSGASTSGTMVISRLGRVTTSWAGARCS